jgi:hypothetical protein
MNLDHFEDFAIVPVKWDNIACGVAILIGGLIAAVSSAFIETDDYRRPWRNMGGIAFGALGILAVWFGGFALLVNF